MVPVDHDIFNRSLPRNPERTLRGLASMAGRELAAQRVLSPLQGVGAIDMCVKGVMIHSTTGTTRVNVELS